MATQDDYDKAVKRGGFLLAEIDKTPSQTNTSPWTLFSSLASEGWTQQIFGNGTRFEDSDANTPVPAGALHTFGSLTGSRRSTWRHKANAGAYHMQSYHPSGVIVVADLRSPKHAAQLAKENLRVPVPKLQHWSDVTFLQWTEFVRDVPAMQKELKKIVHCSVTNHETLAILQHILGTDYSKPLQFPGKTFTRAQDGENFMALLGSANGMGTGFLLAEHKEQLGWKTVASIQIYTEISWFVVFNLEEKSLSSG